MSHVIGHNVDFLCGNALSLANFYAQHLFGNAQPVAVIINVGETDPIDTLPKNKELIVSCSFQYIGQKEVILQYVHLVWCHHNGMKLIFWIVCSQHLQLSNSLGINVSL